MLRAVHHVHYIVRSRSAFVAFMERSFGAKPDALESRTSGLGTGNQDATYMIGDTILEVTEPGPDTLHRRFLEKHGPGVWHVAWTVAGIEALTAQLKSRGIRTAGAPLDRPPLKEQGVTDSHWGYKHANLNPEDSDGVHFQLAEDHPVADAERAARANGRAVLKGVHHVHYIVRDRDKLLAFMERGFGLKAAILEDRPSGLGAGNKDATFKIGNLLMEVSAPTTGPEKTLHGRVLAKHGPGVYHVAWRVEGIKELANKLEANGTRVHGGPRDIMGEHGGVSPSHWGYWHVNINPEDSEGVHFQLAEGDASWDRDSARPAQGH
jgi:catechol 2,3-dioxygenase-like lactoylglutathione lyase family enzyme